MNISETSSPDPLSYLPHDGRIFEGRPPADAATPEQARANALVSIRKLMAEHQQQMKQCDRPRPTPDTSAVSAPADAITGPSAPHTAAPVILCPDVPSALHRTPWGAPRAPVPTAARRSGAGPASRALRHWPGLLPLGALVLVVMVWPPLLPLVMLTMFAATLLLHVVPGAAPLVAKLHDGLVRMAQRPLVPGLVDRQPRHGPDAAALPKVSRRPGPKRRILSKRPDPFDRIAKTARGG